MIIVITLGMYLTVIMLENLTLIVDRIY